MEVGGGTDLDGPAEWTLTGDTTIDEGQTAVYTLALSQSFGENENAKKDEEPSESETEEVSAADMHQVLQEPGHTFVAHPVQDPSQGNTQVIELTDVLRSIGLHTRRTVLRY